MRSDPLLAQRLADALAADQIAAERARSDASGRCAGDGGRRRQPQLPATRTRAAAARRAARARYTEVVRAAAGFLAREDGPQVAVFDTTGWDTHANEGGAQGQLAGRLAALDAGCAPSRSELGPSGSDTAVLLATEFGRTAAVNGTRGTDHGTGTAAFLLGGAVRGGRVIADWPGLSARALYQGRDLEADAGSARGAQGRAAGALLIPPRALETRSSPGPSGRARSRA